MSKESIETAIKLIPNLTVFGVGISCRGVGLSKTERLEKFRSEQQELFSNIEVFEKAVTWLSKVEKIKSINYQRSSYGLKHVAEKEIGYIANGVFIAAAVYCGFAFKIYPDSPNVSFNMSEKSIKTLERSNA